MKHHKIYTTPFSVVYLCYIAKAEKKNRTKQEVDAIITWLTGYSIMELEAQLEQQVDVQTFFAQAPKLNSARKLIKGVICGVRIETLTDPVMREIRYLDKLIDELARDKALEKIFRISE